MIIRNWYTQIFQRYRSAWLVGVVFALLIILGLIWRGFYLFFLDEQNEQRQITETLIEKSELIEQLIIATRNRSVFLAQMLFKHHISTESSIEAFRRFETEALKVIESRQAYMNIADAYEKEILDQHYELASQNRANQDYLLSLIEEGELEAAAHEYTSSTLPIQELALSLLDDLHAHIAQQRDANKQRIDHQSWLLTNIVTYSTSFYLLLLFVLASFVVWRLIKNSRAQANLQEQLNDQLLEKNSSL
ncbi:MAG: hypothetical protein M1579_04495 [Gammaproteobacteria bacterium]|nr:hypothetical protein [Gammaproteobacteria bacterium]